MYGCVRLIGPFFPRELFVNLLRGTEDPEEALSTTLVLLFIQSCFVLVLPDCDLVYPVKCGGCVLDVHFGEYEDSYYFRGDSLEGAGL